MVNAPYVPQTEGYDLNYLMKYAYRHQAPTSKGTRYYSDRTTYSAYDRAADKKGVYMRETITFPTGYYNIRRYVKWDKKEEKKNAGGGGA